VKVEVFDDKRSITHAVAGFIAAAFPHIGLILLGFFFIYQALEVEDFEDKAGDFIEFLIGAAGWALYHMIRSVL